MINVSAAINQPPNLRYLHTPVRRQNLVTAARMSGATIDWLGFCLASAQKLVLIPNRFFLARPQIGITKTLLYFPGYSCDAVTFSQTEMNIGRVAGQQISGLQAYAFLGLWSSFTLCEHSLGPLNGRTSFADSIFLRGGMPVLSASAVSPLDP